MKLKLLFAALVAVTIFTACDSRPESLALKAKIYSKKCDSGDIGSCFKFLSFVDSVETLSPEGKKRFEQAAGFESTPKALAQIAIALAKKCDAGGKEAISACIRCLTIADKVSKMSPEDQKIFVDAGGFSGYDKDTTKNQP